MSDCAISGDLSRSGQLEHENQTRSVMSQRVSVTIGRAPRNANGDFPDDMDTTASEASIHFPPGGCNFVAVTTELPTRYVHRIWKHESGRIFRTEAQPSLSLGNTGMPGWIETPPYQIPSR